MTTIHDVTREARLRARAARERRVYRADTCDEGACEGACTVVDYTEADRAWYRRPLGR